MCAADAGEAEQATDGPIRGAVSPYVWILTCHELFTASKLLAQTDICV